MPNPDIASTHHALLRPVAGLIALLWILSGCSSDVELPVATPLATAPAIIGELHGARTGPHEVITRRDILLPGEDDYRPLSLNLYFPATGDAFPLLLFSHGNWSDKDSYHRIIEHWVSWGYTVISVNHLDCCSMASGIINSLRYGQLGLIQGRIDDLTRILEQLGELESAAPDFRGKANPERLGITGHSFGAFSAQQLGGAGTLNPDTGEYLYYRNPNVQAVVALSPPGPMFDTITEDSWTQLSAPNLVTTGTWDSHPSFWPDWRLHLMSFTRSPAKEKYALVVDGADHYLGNLICRTEREAQPQDDALTMVKIATTAFLDAYLKDDTDAMAFLNSDALDTTTGEFARLSRSSTEAY